MKYIYLLLVPILNAFNCFSQYCIIGDTTMVNLKRATYSYMPGSPIKYVRVIIHFIQKDDGTGNFNEENDGLNPPNNFNGYEYADYIVNYANSLLSDNQPMNLQPFGQVPVFDPGFRY